MEKNVLAMLIVTHYLAVLDFSLYWNFNMFGTAALNGGVILFKVQ